MRTVRKKWLPFRILFLLALLLFPAFPIQAAVDEEVLPYLESEIETFLENAFTLSEEDLDYLRENGGFYEVFTDTWRSNREESGSFEKILSTSIDDTDPSQLIINSVVQFSKKDADLVFYADPETYAPVNFEMNLRYTMREKMMQAAQNMAVGLIVVFVVLLFLMCIIALFRFLQPRRKEEEAADPAQQTKAVSKSAATPIASTDGAEETASHIRQSEEELVAVMTAAIAAAEADTPSSSGYRIHSLRPVHHRL